MTRETMVFSLGVLILLVPYVGLPEAWKVYFFTCAGILLIIAGYSLRRSRYLKSIEQENGERHSDSFVESTRTIDWPDESATA